MHLKVYNKDKKAPKPNQPIQPGVCAVVLNNERKILLHKRADSDFWALPGGNMEMGESIAQCCLREIREETNLKAQIEKLIGVYTSPECVFEWINGSEKKIWQIFVIAFLCKVEIDQVKLNDESAEFGWFFEEEIKKIDTLPYVKEVVSNSLSEEKVFFD